jgi:hypothetical protein
MPNKYAATMTDSAKKLGFVFVGIIDGYHRFEFPACRGSLEFRYDETSAQLAWKLDNKNFGFIPFNVNDDPNSECVYPRFFETMAREYILRTLPPVRNTAWFPTDPKGCLGFTCECSTLTQGGRLAYRDPWNRPIQDGLGRHTDPEGEVTHYTAVTTVKGVPFALTIFND